MRWRPRLPLATAVPAAVVAIIAIIAALILGLPVTDLGGQVPRDFGDPLLNVWALAWESSSLVEAPRSIFRGNIYWPETAAIAYSESMLPLVPIFGLLWLLTGSELAAHALLLYLLVLSAIGAAYLLARRYVERRATALLAGIAYGLGGYVVAHTAQLQLLTLGSFPLAFWLWFRTMEARSWRWALACGATVAVGALASLYYGVALLVSFAVLAIVELVADRRWSTLRLTAVAGMTAVIVALPGLLVYVDVDDRLGLERAIDPTLELEPDDLISAPQQTLLYVDLAHRALARPPATEHMMFPGFTTLALAGIAAVWLVRRRHRRTRELLGLAAVGVVAFVLALGGESGGVDLPFGWLHDNVAGFDGIRATARLVVPALLLLAVLASIGLDRLLARFDHPRAATLAGVVMAALVLELWAPSPWREVHLEDERLAVYDALDEEDPGVVVELPMGDPRVGFGGETPSWAFTEPTRMLHSLVDRNPRVNGFSGHMPPRYVEFVDRTSSFPSRDSLALIDELGIRYVVLHLGRAADGATQYTEAEARRIVRRLPEEWSAARHGDAWLLARW